MFEHPLLPALVLTQMAMGLLDIVWHHEATEQLAWRPSQTRELRLHAARNLIYAVLFAVLGLASPHGWWAIAAMAALGSEIAITIWEFVEEDRSRKLPATERVLHTVLAINYGGILAILVPMLLAWSQLDTDLVPSGGVLSGAIAMIASVGCLLFGLRDLAAMQRHGLLPQQDDAALARALSRRTRILVTGGTGFVGTALVRALVAAGHEVTVLTRDPRRAVMVAAPLRIVTSLDQIGSCEPIDAIVNLAGEPIAGGLWTAVRRRRILRSRLRVTRDVVQLVARLRQRPQVLVTASAVGWYGLRGDEALDEQAAATPCFTHRVCDAWERASLPVASLGVRRVVLRIGLVLNRDGGMLRGLAIPFEFGLGGRVGSGRQWMSWIARDDLVRLIVHAIVDPALAGPVNAVAPEAVRNDRFVACLARALKRSAWFALPAPLLRLVLGQLADELLLGGQRVVPSKASMWGFRFLHPDIEAALRHTLMPVHTVVAEPAREVSYR